MKQSSLTQLVNARNGVSVLRLVLAQQGEITPDTVVSARRGITATDYLAAIYDEIQLVVDAMVEDIHPTVPLKRDADVGVEAAMAYLAKLQLTKRTSPRRVARKAIMFQFAPRLASEVHMMLPPLTVSRL